MENNKLKNIDTSVVNPDTVTERSMDIIQNTEILNDTDLQKLTDLMPVLNDIDRKNPIFRSRNQMEVSVLNPVAFPDESAKYWQCVREQHVMFQNLLDLTFEWDKVIANLELAEIDLDEIPHDKRYNARARIKKAEIRQLQFALHNFKRTAKDRVREIIEWERLKQKQIEKDPSIDTQNANTNQLESMKKRYVAERIISQEVMNKTLYKNSTSHLQSIEELEKEWDT